MTGAAEAGLWLTLDAANVPNMAMLNPAAADKPYRLPYRGSQVLLAYDSAKIPTPPKTFADLVAWARPIRAASPMAVPTRAVRARTS